MSKPKTYAEAVAALEKRRTPLRVKGHKLTRSTSGCEDTYQRGDCECGERYKGWTESRWTVTMWHRGHLDSVYLAPFKEAERKRVKEARDAQHCPGPWDGATLLPAERAA